MIPCKHDPKIPDKCKLCKLYETREDYRQLWDRPKIENQKDCGCKGKPPANFRQEASERIKR